MNERSSQIAANPAAVIDGDHLTDGLRTDNNWERGLTMPAAQGIIGVVTSRFFIFAVVGPLIGLSALALKVGMLVLVAFDDASIRTGSVTTVSDTRLAGWILAAAYVIGLFPALVTATADRHFEASPHRKQWAATIGGLSSLLLVMALFRGRTDAFVAMFAVCGSIAGFVCSWLHKILHTHLMK
jgi:hypothetical protein